MKIRLSSHARKRLNEYRQDGVTQHDVNVWASRVPGIVTDFRHRCKTRGGKKFDLVLDDNGGERVIVTIIGKK